MPAKLFTNRQLTVPAGRTLHAFLRRQGAAESEISCLSRWKLGFLLQGVVFGTVKGHCQPPAVSQGRSTGICSSGNDSLRRWDGKSFDRFTRVSRRGGEARRIIVSSWSRVSVFWQERDSTSVRKERGRWGWNERRKLVSVIIDDR